MTITRNHIITAVRAQCATVQEIAEHCGCRDADVRKAISNAKDAGLLETYLDDVTGKPAYKLTADGIKWQPVDKVESMRDAKAAKSEIPTATYSPAVLEAIKADLAGSEGGEMDISATRPQIEPGDDFTTRAVKLAVRNHNDRLEAEQRADNAAKQLADFARDPELQYLAPEDYEMPPADPVLLALANRMLSERMDGVAHALRGCGLPALAKVTGAEDLQPAVAALSGAYQMQCAEIDNAKALADKLKTLFDSARHEADHLRAQLDAEHAATDDDNDEIAAETAATLFLVRAKKRPPRICWTFDAAQSAAMAAARNGSGRGEVFALLPVGIAKRGVEWSDAK